jgi:hypothetical protein
MTTEIDTEMERSLSEIDLVSSVFADGFVTKIFNDGIVKTVTPEKIHQYLSNPDNYIRELENVAHYFYMSNAAVFQLFDLVKVLPTLNYRINIIDKSKNYEKNINTCNKIMQKIKHKSLTRDIMSQLISSGTLTGIWLGDKRKPYLYIFDRPDRAFPALRVNGEWIIRVDLSWLEEMSNLERESFIGSLTPYITKEAYTNYLNNKTDTYKYVDLPTEKTVCLRTHTLKRNQAFGVSWATTGLNDILHKDKLKNLEKSIANKIISAIAVLNIGSEKDEKSSYNKLNKELRKKILSGVKNVLERNQTQAISVIGLPEYAKLSFPDAANSNALDSKKFVSINSDINSSYGLSSAITMGTGGTFASGKLNLDAIYKRVAILLEDIETEVYGKLFNIILPSSVSDEYALEYDKEAPLTLKEKTDYLMKLNNQMGFSLKAVVDNLSGIDFNEYINQSIYEQETLKLQDKIKPYASSYTSNDTSTKPSTENVDNENTDKTKTNDSNGTPTS